MSIGLIALLDDIAAIAKAAAASLDDVATQAAKAGVKAAGVVIDDTAVTPRYVLGFAAERELPIVGKIAAGSLRNKLLLLLPATLALSYFIPWMITPLLMFGGAYLCYEGAEKVLEATIGLIVGIFPTLWLIRVGVCRNWDHCRGLWRGSTDRESRRRRCGSCEERPRLGYGGYKPCIRTCPCSRYARLPDISPCRRDGRNACIKMLALGTAASVIAMISAERMKSVLMAVWKRTACISLAKPSTPLPKQLLTRCRPPPER